MLTSVPSCFHQVAHGRTNEAFAASNHTMPYFYRHAATAFPTVSWSQYSAAYDQNQVSEVEGRLDPVL